MKNSKRRKRFEVAPPVTRGRRKRLVVQALTEEVWTLCLEFTIDKVQTWSSMQLVSKEFHRCLRKARALSHFLFHLYRVESLERLGVSATGIRRLKLGLTRCDNITDANLQALSSLVALETLSLGGCSRIIDLQALAPLVVLKTVILDCPSRKLMRLSYWQQNHKPFRSWATPLLALQTVGSFGNKARHSLLSINACVVHKFVWSLTWLWNLIKIDCCCQSVPPKCSCTACISRSTSCSTQDPDSPLDWGSTRSRSAKLLVVSLRIFETFCSLAASRTT